MTQQRVEEPPRAQPVSPPAAAEGGESQGPGMDPREEPADPVF